MIYLLSALGVIYAICAICFAVWVLRQRYMAREDMPEQFTHLVAVHIEQWDPVCKVTVHQNCSAYKIKYSNGIEQACLIQNN